MEELYIAVTAQETERYDFREEEDFLLSGDSRFRADMIERGLSPEEELPE